MGQEHRSEDMNGAGEALESSTVKQRPSSIYHLTSAPALPSVPSRSRASGPGSSEDEDLGSTCEGNGMRRLGVVLEFSELLLLVVTF